MSCSSGRNVDPAGAQSPATIHAARINKPRVIRVCARAARDGTSPITTHIPLPLGRSVLRNGPIFIKSNSYRGPIPDIFILFFEYFF